MGVASIIRNIKRLKEISKEIESRKPSVPQDLIRKKLFITEDLYNECQSIKNSNPLYMAGLSRIGGLQLNKIYQLYANTKAEAEKYGIKTNAMDGIGESGERYG